MRWGAYSVVFGILFLTSTLCRSVHAQNISVSFSQVIKSNLSVEYRLFARSINRLEISLSKKNITSEKIVFFSDLRVIETKYQKYSGFKQDNSNKIFTKINVTKRVEKGHPGFYCFSCRSG